MSDDDLFATLSGSLMKDLLADLAAEDGDAGFMSLEELEKELAYLDSGSTAPKLSQPSPAPPTSAAAMVMANRHDPVTPSAPVSSAAMNKGPALDAWSLSVQNFSATAFEQEFLKADSARKQQQQRTPTGMPPGLDLSNAQEYNINEGLRVVPPPGISSYPSSVPSVPETSVAPSSEANILTQAAARLVAQMQQGGTASVDDTLSPLPSNIPKPVPATPQNSVTIRGGQVEAPTPRNSVVVHADNIPPTPPPSATATPSVNRHQELPTAAVSPMVGNAPYIPQMMMPQQVPPGAMPIPTPTIPVAVPVRGTAWQQPGPPPPSQPRYCNPHPRAPTVPATDLKSTYMTPRDIGYVIHGILRHIQAAGASSVDDYDVQYWVRRNGSKAAEQAVLSRPTPQKKKGDKTAKETASEAALAVLEQRSRQAKAKEWSNEHSTLGLVTKTNVHRPRALLAQPVVADQNAAGSEQKQRAALWKARIYADQAYQALDKVMELWRMAQPGQVPASMHPHLLKLLKCMGIQKAATDGDNDHQEYRVTDEDAMKLLLKLDKGKNLLSRVLEQALLPPKAVQVALPVMLKVLLSPASASTKAGGTDTSADNRIFSIVSRIVESLPDLSPECLLASVEVMHSSSEQALLSTSRMQCMHSLLHRGSVVSQDPTSPEGFKQAWGKIEESFLEILSAM